MNGDTIERIGNILNGDEEIPAKVTNAMIFVAIKHERDERKEDYTFMKDELKKIKENPMIKFGDFLSKYPKIAWFVGVLLVVILGFLLSGAEIPAWVVEILQ